MTPTEIAPDERTAHLPHLRALYPALARTVRFPSGKVVLTPGASQALRENEGCALLDYLIRHLTGDWGNVDEQDRKANDDALRLGTRLLSAYELPDNQTLWIITEADRSATTALLPEEY